MNQPNLPNDSISHHWLYTRIETPEQVIIRYERSYLILGGMVAGWVAVFSAMILNGQQESDLVLAGVGLGISFILTIVEIAANWSATWETFDGYQRGAVKTSGYGFSPKNPYTVTISKMGGSTSKPSKAD